VQGNIFLADTRQLAHVLSQSGIARNLGAATQFHAIRILNAGHNGFSHAPCRTDYPDFDQFNLLENNFTNLRTTIVIGRA
jgi:hypothetical protein